MEDRDYKVHSFEAKIIWTGPKSRLLDCTVPLEDGHHKYFVPIKCTIELGESDVDGNIQFTVNDWWWNKKHDFRADE